MSQPAKRPRQDFRERSGLKSAFALILVLLVYYWSAQGLGIEPEKFASGETWRQMGDLVIRLGPFERINTCKNAKIVWGEPDPISEAPWSGKTNLNKVKAVCEQAKTLYWYRSDYLADQFAYARDVWDPLMQTLRMAIIGSLLGALLAIPFSLQAASNLVRSKLVYYVVRVVLNLIRTVPDLVLAAVLSGALGLGALPGVTALVIFSFALVAKLLSESIEAIDPGPLEAMQACGANWYQMVAYGVVPQVLPQFLAYTIYVLEVDVRASTVLGLVGAGGIGQILIADLNLTRFRNVGAVIAIILVMVVIMELISTKVRERLV